MEQFECQYNLPTSHNIIMAPLNMPISQNDFFAVPSFLQNGAE